MFGKLNRYTLNGRVENKTYRNTVIDLYEKHYKKDPKAFYNMMEALCKLAVEDTKIDKKTFYGLMNLRSRAYFKSTGLFNI